LIQDTGYGAPQVYFRLQMRRFVSELGWLRVQSWANFRTFTPKNYWTAREIYQSTWGFLRYIALFWNQTLPKRLK